MNSNPNPNPNPDGGLSFVLQTVFWGGRETSEGSTGMGFPKKSGVGSTGPHPDHNRDCGPDCDPPAPLLRMPQQGLLSRHLTYQAPCQAASGLNHNSNTDPSPEVSMGGSPQSPRVSSADSASQQLGGGTC
ncbi:unnamed protein product, partial [Discosporangium mesarthrocarpum]